MTGGAPDYGSRGLIGILTPQANTTVEPECWTLLPGGYSMITARLTSECVTIEERLIDYAARYHKSAAQFANAPLDAIAIACTGTSYLLEQEDEFRIIEELQRKLEVPCVTAAQATLDALRVVGAERLALLTPYPESLQRVSMKFWQSHGFEVVASTGPTLRDDTFHPIYSLSHESVYQSYHELCESDADVVLMLGTGMTTLGALLRGHDAGLKPALSCNLALMWRVVEKVRGATPESTFPIWQSGSHWRSRFNDISGMK